MAAGAHAIRTRHRVKPFSIFNHEPRLCIVDRGEASAWLVQNDERKLWMSRDQVLATRDIRPAAFVHFVLQTSRLREQVDFYKAFLNAWEVFGSDMGSFLTYDEEHH